MKSKIFSLPVLGLCLIVNPMWILSACEESREPEFGERDMIDTFSGISMMHEIALPEDGGKIEVVLDVEGLEMQEMSATNSTLVSDFIASASACGESGPEFVLSASACASIQRSLLSFDGAVTMTLVPVTGEPEVLLDAAKISEGAFVVEGYEFDNALIEMVGEVEQDGVKRSFGLKLRDESAKVEDVDLTYVEYVEVEGDTTREIQSADYISFMYVDRVR